MPIMSPTEMIQQKLGPDPKNYTSDAVRALLMQQARAQNQGADTGMPDFITDVAGDEAGPPTRAVAKRRAAGAAPNGMGAAIARSMSAPEGPNSTPPSDIPPSQMNDYNTPVRSAPVGNVGQQVVQGAPITRPGQTVGSDYAQPVDDVNRVINDDPGYRTTPVADGDRTVSAAPVAPPPAPPVPPSTTTSAPPGPVSAAIDKAVDTASPSTVKAPDPPPPPSEPTGPAAGVQVSPNDVGQMRPPGTVMPTASQLPPAIQSLVTDAGGLVPDNQAAQAALALAAIGGPAAATVLGPMAARRMTGGPSPSGISAESNQIFRPDPNPGAPRSAGPSPTVSSATARPGSTGAVGQAPAAFANAPTSTVAPATTGAAIVSNQPPAAAAPPPAPKAAEPAPKAAEPAKAEPPKQQSGSQSRDAARGRAQAASQARAGPPSASYSGIKQPAAGEPNYVEGVKPVGSAAARAPTGGPGTVVDKGLKSAFSTLVEAITNSKAASAARAGTARVGAGIPFIIPPLGKMTPEERAKAVVDRWIRNKK